MQKLNNFIYIDYEFDSLVKTKGSAKAILAGNRIVAQYSSSKYVDDLMDSVFKMSEIVGAKNDLLPENSQWGRDYLISYQNYISGTGDYAINFENHTQKYTDFVNQIFDVSTQTITASWKIISDIFINNSDEYLATAEKYSTSAQSFTIGFENRISAEDYKSISGQPDKIYAYSQNHNSSYSSDYHYPDLSKQMTVLWPWLKSRKQSMCCLHLRLDTWGFTIFMQVDIAKGEFNCV